MLCLLVGEGWIPSSTLKEKIQKWKARNEREVDDLSMLLDRYIGKLNSDYSSNEDSFFGKYKDIYDCLRSEFDGSNTDFEEAIKSVLKGIQEIRKFIGEH